MDLGVGNFFRPVPPPTWGGGPSGARSERYKLERGPPNYPLNVPSSSNPRHPDRDFCRQLSLPAIHGDWLPAPGRPTTQARHPPRCASQRIRHNHGCSILTLGRIWPFSWRSATVRLPSDKCLRGDDGFHILCIRVNAQRFRHPPSQSIVFS